MAPLPRSRTSSGRSLTESRRAPEGSSPAVFRLADREDAGQPKSPINKPILQRPDPGKVPSIRLGLVLPVLILPTRSFIRPEKSPG